METSTSTSTTTSTVVSMDSEKRIRREIANSNERRRMQSINVGYQCLKSLLPHHKGEKLSKAGILQQTSDYVQVLEKEKTQLLIQNAQLRQKLKEVNPQALDGISPPPKRKKRDTESSDEGIGMGFDDAATDLLELKKQLDRERHQRMYLEQRIHNLEAQMDPEKSAVIIKQIVPSPGPPQATIASSVPKPTTIATAATPASAPTITRIPALIEKERPEPEVMEVTTTPAVIKPESPVIAMEEGEVSSQPGAAPSSVNIHPVNLSKSAPIDVPSRRGVVANKNHPRQSEFTSPQSKRNLEMIAEAIRHLEGETLFGDMDSCSTSLHSSKCVSTSAPQRHQHRMMAAGEHRYHSKPRSIQGNIPNNSEESQTESSNSDQEDYNGGSGSSGCESPLSLSNPDNNTIGNSSNNSLNVGLIRAAATLCVTTAPAKQPQFQHHPCSVATPVQMPITKAMHLVTASTPSAGFFRPGVIVHKAS